MDKQIKAYWSSLEPRERMVLAWGAVIVAVILMYTLVWQPWRHALSFMEASVRDMRVNAVWMEQRAQDMQRTGGPRTAQSKPRRGAGQSLTAVVEQTANQARVRDAIQQIVPNQTTGEVRVVLEGVGFNQWVQWIDNLYKNYGVDISQINAEKDDEKPNIAEIRMTFVRDQG